MRDTSKQKNNIKKAENRHVNFVSIFFHLQTILEEFTAAGYWIPETEIPLPLGSFTIDYA